MADPKQRKPLLVSGSDAAPVVYFDGLVAWGVNKGVVQIEAAANELVPNEPGAPSPIKTKVVITAHLRMPIETARELRAMLDAAITSATPTDKKSN